MALERGSQPGGNLADELRSLGAYAISTPADASAVCDLLERLVPADSRVGGPDALGALLRLFEFIDTEVPGAFTVFQKRGMMLLVQIVNDALEDRSRREVHDVLYALLLLALYVTPEGTDIVIRAARLPFEPDNFRWKSILELYTTRRPGRKRLFRALSRPLPDGFLAIALLDAANEAKCGGARFPHPFDSPEGVTRLERYLSDRDEKHFSYAASATEALPYIGGLSQGDLLALAFDHPDSDVQLRAARKSADLGSESSVEFLVRSCLDVNLSERAKRQLIDMGRADAIPPAANERAFEVRAHFAEWLADPRELSRYPDEVEIIDRRVLNWPPEGRPIEQWLLRFKATVPQFYQPVVIGIGLVGSMTFSFVFVHEMDERPFEDCYALHCFAEMQGRRLISDYHFPKEDGEAGEYNSMLANCGIDGIEDADIECVVDLSPELKQPGQLIAAATARRHGTPGCIVLDGPRSRWYPATEMPEETGAMTVLMIHIGRALIGFTEEPDRRKFIKPKTTTEPATDSVEDG